MERGRLERPELWLRNRERCGELGFGAGGDRQVSARFRRDGLAVGREDGLGELKRRGGAAFVGDRRAGGDVGVREVGAHVARDKCAPARDVQRRGFREPDVAIDSGTLVEPAFLHGGVDAHGDDIFSAVVEVVADVIAGVQISTRLLANIEPIDENARGTKNSAPVLVRSRPRLTPFAVGPKVNPCI